MVGPTCSSNGGSRGGARGAARAGMREMRKTHDPIVLLSSPVARKGALPMVQTHGLGPRLQSRGDRLTGDTLPATGSGKNRGRIGPLAPQQASRYMHSQATSLSPSIHMGAWTLRTTLLTQSHSRSDAHRSCAVASTQEFEQMISFLPLTNA